MKKDSMFFSSRLLIRIKHLDIMAFCFALLALLKCWLYARQSGSETTVFVCDIIIYMCSIVTFVYVFAKYRFEMQNIKFAVFPVVYILANILYRYDGGINVNDAGITVVSIAILYLLLPQYCQMYIYKMFRYILVFCSILGIVFYMVYMIQLPIPYNSVPYYAQITQPDALYADYFNIVLYISAGGMVRLCGPFNEPGLMGTFLGLVLIAEDMNLRKKGNLILFIAGAITYSMAYVVIILLYFLYTYGKDWRLFILVILGLMLVIILPNIQFENATLQDLINRLFRGDDNRTTRKFDIMFEEFIKTSRLWFGNGSGIQTVGVSSIKLYIMQYGIVGTVFYLLYILRMGLFFSNRNKKSIVFLTIFLLSMYQRPDVISPGYFIILIGGIHAINYGNNVKEYTSLV